MARKTANGVTSGQAMPPGTQPRLQAPWVLGNYSPTTPVLPEDALAVPEILSCVRVLAEEMAALPLILVKDDGKDCKPAREHPAFDLFLNRPNAEMTSYELMTWMMTDSLLRRAGFAQVIRNLNNEILEIWPLDSRRVSPWRAPDGTLLFSYGGEDGEYFRDDEILRVQVLPYDGILGQSLIDMQGKTLGQAKAANDSAGEFLANGSQVSGILSVPGTLSEDAYKRIKDSWSARNEGNGKRHRVAVLEGGAEFKPTMLKADEAQLLESRKFNRSTIAGLFRVPAHLINDLNGATFSNIEAQELGFYKHTLRPWARNWELRLNTTILSKEERAAGYKFIFDFDDLLRGDLPSRATAYGQMINSGVLTINEARRRENLPPVEGGNINFVQGALRPATEPYSKTGDTPNA